MALERSLATRSVTKKEIGLGSGYFPPSLTSGTSYKEPPSREDGLPRGLVAVPPVPMVETYVVVARRILVPRLQPLMVLATMMVLPPAASAVKNVVVEIPLVLLPTTVSACHWPIRQKLLREVRRMFCGPHLSQFSHF